MNKERRFKIPERFRPDTADKPGYRSFYFDTDIPDINRVIPSKLPDKIGQEFPGMSGMGCCTDTYSNKDHT